MRTTTTASCVDGSPATNNGESDFRGLKGTSFDGRGNYATGLKEHIVFPEINYDQIDQMWGMDIIVCTTAKTDEEAKALLTEFKFPFVN